MITTVGPYQQYGMPLVEACARSGTHYADLTGEVLFMRQTADRWHETAEGSAARIVHACGFDSIRRISECCSSTRPFRRTTSGSWATPRSW